MWAVLAVQNCTLFRATVVQVDLGAILKAVISYAFGGDFQSASTRAIVNRHFELKTIASVVALPFREDTDEKTVPSSLRLLL